jgi:hypothetical protein
MAAGFIFRGRTSRKATLDDGVGNRTVIATRDLVPDLTLNFTSQNTETWQHYYRKDVLAASGSVTFSLNDLANPLLVQGLPLRLDNVKYFLLAIDSPDGTKKVKFGPLAASNPAPLWFGATDATGFEEVFDWIERPNRRGSWPTTAGTACNVSILNHSAVSVTTHLWVAGFR